MVALAHKHEARENEKAADEAVRAKKMLVTEEQADNARIIFEYRLRNCLPLGAPGGLEMTDGDRHAVALRRAERGLLDLPSDGSNSSSSSSSSSRSSSRQVPSKAAVWDPRIVRATQELAKAMEDATSAADLADAARRASASAIDARVQERGQAEEAARAPERTGESQEDLHVT
jgi:hypothetical protein